MTTDSLMDALVCADIPSRTVLTSVLQDGLLKKSIFASNAFIYHFDDIRDAIDLVLRGIRGDKHNSNPSMGISMISQRAITEPRSSFNTYTTPPASPQVFHLNHHTLLNNQCLKMNELFDSEEVRFACSRASEDLLKSRQGSDIKLSLPSATILISLEFSQSKNTNDISCGIENKNNYNNQDILPIPFDHVDALAEKIKGLLIEYGGPILASSDLKRNLQTGTIFKFFSEFYRTADCDKFLDTSKRIGPVCDQNVSVSFESVHLYDIDREALFFSCCYENATEPDEPEAELEEHNAIPYCFKQRKDSISSIEDSSNSSNSSTTSSTSFGSSHFNFEIDLWKIENGLDKRTTCMIRNIPNKYTQQMIFDLVNESHGGCFDFLYLRMDFRNRCNVGYAFINFTHPDQIISFAKRVNGKRWARFNSDKVCHLTFARIQGTGALIDKFRTSKVMFEAPAYRPKLFHVAGPLIGQEAPFPT